MSHAQTLKSLLVDIYDVPKALDAQIYGITMDSRKVKPGDLFIGVSGIAHNADAFVDQAISQGAAAVLIENSALDTASTLCERGSAIFLNLVNLKNVLGTIAGRFFGEPSRQLSVIGITGTNGKTSVSHYLSQVLNYLGCKCGVIGTLGYGMTENLSPASHTTPDVITNQQWLSTMKQEGAKSVVMEVFGARAGRWYFVCRCDFYQSK